MKIIEDLLDRVAPKFKKGGPLERFYPLFEAGETLILTPADVTKKGPHVRDALDMKRLMTIVVAAVLPCFFFGVYNTGLQSLAARGLPTDILPCMITGLIAVGPIVIVSYAVGGFWEVLFAVVRRHEINEGFFVTGLLFPLILAPTTPLWMVAAGISFGVVLGKEVFGGTGMNILNPALTGRAFVFFAYPAAISGDRVWTLADRGKDKLIDGFTGATPLLEAANAVGAQATAAMSDAGFSLIDLIVGTVPGSIGETSVVACLIGAAILIVSGIGSWRIMLATILGAVGLSYVMCSAAGPESSGIMSLPPLWHIVSGGFLFGAVFMATDPVSAAGTRTGEWIYGFGIGALCILVRTVNPAYPEGMMLAILFMNVFAPLIDHVVIKAHCAGRERRRKANA